MIMSSHNSLVKKGKACISVVRNALDDIENGRKQMGLQKLSSVQKDGELLVYAAEQLAERLEAVERYFLEKDSEILRETDALAKREAQLKSQKCGEESQLAAQQSILQDNEDRLSSAEENLRDAERKRRKAEKDENSRLGKTVAVSAVVGLFTFGIGGAVVGAAAGMGLGAIVNSCREDEEKAQSIVNRCRNDRDNARFNVNESERRVSSVKSQIANLTIEIERMTRQRQQSHKKVDNVRSLIVIVKKSVSFWKLFQQSAEHGVERTDLLRKLVTMAANREQYQTVIQSESSQFIDVWEEIVAKVENDGLNHLVEIAYRCTQCRVHCNALPYIADTRFVCIKCHSEYALT